jgi:lysozyme family protein
MSTADQRKRMGMAILAFEARRDAKGHLAIYNLPAGDGGGKYEVAGINDRYHKAEADELVALIRAAKYREAEDYAVEVIAAYTDLVIGWSTDAGVEFYLRDCAFNRGPRGATRILQRAVGVQDDGEIGPQTCSAVADIGSEQLLVRLRVAREQYERDVVHRNETSKFWRGLVNRWDNALSTARKFSAEKTARDEPAAPTATAPAGWIGALVAAMLAWFGKRKLTAAPKSEPEKLGARMSRRRRPRLLRRGWLRP